VLGKGENEFMKAIAALAGTGGKLFRMATPRKGRKQDSETVKLLRLSIGAVGVLLPVGLIVVNWVRHFWHQGSSFVIIPTSMSGSYWTTARDLFVGSLCALGVFLIGYRHTRLQDLCSTAAGICALLVAFNPTAPAAGTAPTEPSWVNYLHHAAAGFLLVALGVFCFVFFKEYVQRGAGMKQPTGGPRRLAGSLKAWGDTIWGVLKPSDWSADTIYFIAGFIVIAAVITALITGVLGVGSNWPLLYLLEALAVFAFGSAWITASLEDMDLHPAGASDS
jgi:hypothetical protein